MFTNTQQLINSHTYHNSETVHGSITCCTLIKAVLYAFL